MTVRRAFLYSLASTLVLPYLSCASKNALRAKHYDTAILAILAAIERDERSAFLHIADRTADALIARNRCFVFTHFGLVKEYLQSRTAFFPPLFIPLLSNEMAATLREGDIVFTTHTDPIVETARGTGATVIGLTSPDFSKNLFEDSTHRSANEPGINRSAPLFLNAPIPDGDGVVSRENHPSGILPGTGVVVSSVITALAAEIYRRSGGIGLTGAKEPTDAIAVIDLLDERIGRIDSLRDQMRLAGKQIADSIIEGGTVRVYDAENCIGAEIAEGTGVPSFLKPLAKFELAGGVLTKKDVLIFAAATSNKPESISLIKTARFGTESIITLCPHDDTGGYRLFKESAFAFDNFCPEREGIITFDAGKRTFFGLGTILNVVLLWSIVLEAVDALTGSGHTPSFGTAPAGSGSSLPGK